MISLLALISYAFGFAGAGNIEGSGTETSGSTL